MCLLRAWRFTPDILPFITLPAAAELVHLSPLAIEIRDLWDPHFLGQRLPRLVRMSVASQAVH